MSDPGILVLIGACFLFVQAAMFLYVRRQLRSTQEQLGGLMKVINALDAKVSALTRKVEDESHAAMEALDLVRKLERYGDPPPSAP